MVFAVWAAPEPLVDGHLRPRARARRLRPPRALGAREARLRGERALRVSARLPGPLLREAPLQLRPARAGRLLHLPRDGPRRRRAAPRARASVRARRRSSPVAQAAAAGRVELRGETGDPVAPVDPHARRAGRDRSVSPVRARSSSHRGTRPLAPRRPPCRRASPPGNRRSSTGTPKRRAEHDARAGHLLLELGGRDLRQVGMRQRVGGELPACRDQKPDLLSAGAPTSRVVFLHLEVRARRASRGSWRIGPRSRTGCGSRRRTRRRSGGSGKRRPIRQWS